MAKDKLSAVQVTLPRTCPRIPRPSTHKRRTSQKPVLGTSVTSAGADDYKLGVGLQGTRARSKRSSARAPVKAVLGRPTSLHKRADEVLALKKKGMGLRAISRQLGMAVSSVHSVLPGTKANR